MIFFTVTNTRKKRSLLLKLSLVLVMVAFVLPYLHNMMVEVSAMQDLQVELEIPLSQNEEGNIKEEEFPGEPVRVDGELWMPLGHWVEVATQLTY